MSQKKPKVKNLRSVLESPLSIHWSKINLEEAASLQKILEELLPLAKLENKSLNLLSKDKNKEKTHPCTTTLKKKHNNIFRTYLTPGFQSVIRGLEKNELCCVLMSGDISPPMLQKVVCSYCNTYNSPLIILPDLKTITKSTLGFSTMVLGLKKTAESPENKFYPIYEIVSQNPCVFETDFVVKQKEDTTQPQDDECVLRNEESRMSSVKIQDCYLYRKKINERTFRPGTEANSTVNSPCQITSKEGMNENFISFSKNEAKSSEIKFSEKIVPKTLNSSESENSDSDDDSLDEDNIFFVDNKPDHTLIETEPLNVEGKNPQINKQFGRSAVKPGLNRKIEITKQKVKTKNERYFSSQENQNEKTGKVRKKGKKFIKQQTAGFSKSGSIERREKPTSSAYKPLKIKTIISNSKKMKRKKK